MTEVIGLTGGIASGKSLVSAYLADKGYPIVDADIVAREVVAPHSPGIQAIHQAFGDLVIKPDGNLDRKRLGTMVFNDAGKLNKLNEILQPLIRQKIESSLEALRNQDHSLVFLVVPLLYEQGYQSLCNQVIVVYVKPEVQLARLMHRDHLGKVAAQARIDAQMPLKQKAAMADLVINNNGDANQAYAAIDSWLKRTLD